MRAWKTEEEEEAEKLAGHFLQLNQLFKALGFSKCGHWPPASLSMKRTLVLTWIDEYVTIF